MSSFLASANSLETKRCCISGSPPEIVSPPPIVSNPVAYFCSSSVACAIVMGMPFDSVHVSGLWQYWQRNMHEVVQATSRTPGPSTQEPVVKECRKPMSPLWSAARTSGSGMSLPRSVRISNGLAASRGTDLVLLASAILCSVKCSRNDVHLLRTSQPYEI